MFPLYSGDTSFNLAEATGGGQVAAFEMGPTIQLLRYNKLWAVMLMLCISIQVFRFSYISNITIFYWCLPFLGTPISKHFIFCPWNLAKIIVTSLKGLDFIGLTEPSGPYYWTLLGITCQWILYICEFNEPPGPWPFSSEFFYIPRLNPRFNVDAHHLAVSNTFETVQYYSSRFLWTIYSLMIVFLCPSLRRLHGWHQ